MDGRRSRRHPRAATCSRPTPRDATPNIGTKVRRTITYDPTPADTLVPNANVTSPTRRTGVHDGADHHLGTATDNAVVTRGPAVDPAWPVDAYVYWNGTSWMLRLENATVDASLAYAGGGLDGVDLLVGSAGRRGRTG